MDSIAQASIEVGSYKVTIKIYADDIADLLEHTDMASEIKNNCNWSIPDPVYASLNEHGASLAICNHSHLAYVGVTDCFNHKRFFLLRDRVTELRDSFVDYAKEQGQVLSGNEAWKKAIKALQSDTRYISEFYNNHWSFVGFVVNVESTMTCDKGLIWSREVENPDNALWGIEWDNGVGSVINNKTTFEYLVPELLPEGVSLNPNQVTKLFNDLNW